MQLLDECRRNRSTRILASPASTPVYNTCTDLPDLHVDLGPTRTTAEEDAADPQCDPEPSARCSSFATHADGNLPW